MNKMARLYCIGSSFPAQSIWHVRAVQFGLVSASIFMQWVLNECRLRGNTSLVFQLAVLAIQLSWTVAWIAARHYLVFDNTVSTRARTLEILEKAGREDMAKRVDEAITIPIARQLVFVDPLLMNAITMPTAWLHLTATWGDDTGERLLYSLGFQVCLAFLQYSCVLASVGWLMVCRYNALQVELLHDEIETAFADLGAATSMMEEETGNGEQQGEGVVSGRLDLAFFKLDWVLQKTVRARPTTHTPTPPSPTCTQVDFVDISKTLEVTTKHLGYARGIDIVLQMVTAGMLGLSMLLLVVKVDTLVLILACVFFATQNIEHPMVANKQLLRLRALAWECYRELLHHGMLFRGADGEQDLEAFRSYAEYNRVVNAGNHLLNIIQTSRDGIKLGNVRFALTRSRPITNSLRAQTEFSNNLTMKILSVSFSAAVVILRTADWSEIAGVKLEQNATQS
jgi:hypothetical protein